MRPLLHRVVDRRAPVASEAQEGAGVDSIDARALKAGTAAAPL
jgi:hypothetical protein